MQSNISLPPFKPSMFCWICGKFVWFEQLKLDEHGHAVHEACYLKRIAKRTATENSGDKSANAA